MTTPEYCTEHGHQQFLSTDNGLCCPKCFPTVREMKSSGCMPDSTPRGPYASEQEAIDDCREDSMEY